MTPLQIFAPVRNRDFNSAPIATIGLPTYYYEVGWVIRTLSRRVGKWQKSCGSILRAPAVSDFGVHPLEVTLDVSPDLLRRQVTLVGSWTFSRQGQAECAEFIADRNVDVERLFTHRWPLEQAEEAYRLFARQTTGKAVILPP